MRLRKLLLKNFRGYKDLCIDLQENINVIIGKNDIGKSTIMEAMEIFFNGDSRQAIVKAEIEDCNIYCEQKEMSIGACFEIEDGEKIVIDSTNPTSLKEEFLLNKEGYLEIHKIWNCSKQKLSATDLKIYIKANYPEVFDKEIITLNNAKLKKMLEAIKDEISQDNISKAINASMRKALYQYYVNEDTALSEKLIDTKNIDTDAKNIWDRLKGHFPLFFLFQSDRANSDSDNEVQNPLKIATKKALEEVKDRLEFIEQFIDKTVEKIGEETIEKLREFDPEIAQKLKTNLKFKSPWDSIFKYDLESDDGIPLNKRGSGVKRLILLSYFRAEAERIANSSSNTNIIYAIEEPETSQHPDFQNMIMESLLEISEDSKHQIIITTHTPEIAKMVQKQSLILLDKNENKEPILVRDEELKLKGIVKTLGVLPTIESRYIICVEGETDATFLRTINKNIDEFKNIINLDDNDISILPMIGSNLVNWVNRNYLDKSNIKEFHLYDGDKDENKKIIADINSKNDGRRFGAILDRREIENYIPINLIEEEFGIDLTPYKEQWTNFDVSKFVQGKKSKLKEKNIKMILNGKVAKKITKQHLEEHGSYEEIKSWFQHISSAFSEYK